MRGKVTGSQTLLSVALVILCCGGVAMATGERIVHDAEYYILEAQNGERWAAEDRELDARLAQLRSGATRNRRPR